MHELILYKFQGWGFQQFLCAPVGFDISHLKVSDACDPFDDRNGSLAANHSMSITVILALYTNIGLGFNYADDYRYHTVLDIIWSTIRH